MWDGFEHQVGVARSVLIAAIVVIMHIGLVSGAILWFVN